MNCDKGNDEKVFRTLLNHKAIKIDVFFVYRKNSFVLFSTLIEVKSNAGIYKQK